MPRYVPLAFALSTPGEPAGEPFYLSANSRHTVLLDLTFRFGLGSSLYYRH